MDFDPLYAAGPGRPVNLADVDPSVVGRQLQIGAQSITLPLGMRGRQSYDGLPAAPEAAVGSEVPDPSLGYQPTTRDRIGGAVASFGANTDPNSVYAPEQFFGSAARGFAGVKTYLNNLRATHAEGQRQKQRDDLERRNIESQIADRARLQAQGTTADYITDPSDPLMEVQVDRDRQGNRVWARDPDGRPIRRKKSEGRASQAGNQAFDNVAGLRKEFQGIIAPHQVIARASQAIENAAQNPSAANDLSLIFSYMKILDPGSTVREGEFANAQNAGGVGDRVVAMYNRIRNGERLSDAQRQGFLESSRGLVRSQRTQAQQYSRRYSDLARYYGFEPSEVVSDPYDFGGTAPTTTPPEPRINF